MSKKFLFPILFIVCFAISCAQNQFEGTQKIKAEILGSSSTAVSVQYMLGKIKILDTFKLKNPAVVHILEQKFLNLTVEICGSDHPESLDGKLTYYFHQTILGESTVYTTYKDVRKLLQGQEHLVLWSVKDGINHNPPLKIDPNKQKLDEENESSPLTTETSEREIKEGEKL